MTAWRELTEYTEYAQYVFTWTKSFTYLGDSLLSTITPNGAGGEVTEYNHPDRLGTRLITNQTLGTVSEQAHLPFGRPLNAESSLTTNNRRFTSYDRSAATGLDYAINRTYDSKQGRFTQVDPIGMSSVSLSLPQTLNLYAYCSNDPVNYTDPSGLFFGKLFKWIGKIFRAVNKVLKWVAIVIAVVLVAAFLILTFTPVSLPAFLGDGLGWLLGVMGKIGASSFGAGLAGAIGVEVGATAGSIISAGLVGVGAIASNFAQTKNQPKRKKGNFPCAPGFSQIYAQFGRFLAELLNSQSGHLTNSPLENGGWIYQDRKGKLFFLRAEKYGGEWRRKAGSIDLRTNPPNIRGARIVARAHTHPYNPGTQAAIDAGKLYGGPSSRATNGVDADVELSATDKMPSYVVHQTGISSSGVREITITLANGAITRVNNEKCGGAK